MAGMLAADRTGGLRSGGLAGRLATRKADLCATKPEKEKLFCLPGWWRQMDRAPGFLFSARPEKKNKIIIIIAFINYDLGRARKKEKGTQQGSGSPTS